MKRVATIGLVAIAVALAACGRHRQAKRVQGPEPIEDPNAQVQEPQQGAFLGQDPHFAGEPGAQPAIANAPQEPTPAPIAEPAAGQGTCQASCALYLGCKGINNARTTQACIARCGQLGKSQAELAQFERLACPAAIAAIEGAPRAPAAQGGALACPTPVSATKTAQDDQIYKILTSRRFCGFTYNQRTGVSRDMAIVFAPNGLMRHGVKAEMNITFRGPTGAAAGNHYSNDASGTTYCWKVENGQLLYSSNGVSFANFVNKVEDNGHGVIFVQTKLGEYKACD